VPSLWDRKGRRWRPAPLWLEDDKLTVRESEAVAIRECAARLLAGEALRSIRRGLNERGVTTSDRRPVAQPRTLSRMLRSARISGRREHEGGPGFSGCGRLAVMAGRYARPAGGDQAEARPAPNAPSLPDVLDPSLPPGSALRALTGLRAPGRRHFGAGVLPSIQCGLA
jgi:hypothetical protein